VFCLFVLLFFQWVSSLVYTFPRCSIEHQNFFGVDDNVGPVAISIRRERVVEQISNFYDTQSSSTVQSMPKHLYRVILRTSEVCKPHLDPCNTCKWSCLNLIFMKVKNGTGEFLLIKITRLKSYHH